MATYLFAYSGDAVQPATPEEGQASMVAWTAWFTSLGDSVRDPGNPTGPSRTVASDGSVREGTPSAVSGYSVITADSLDDAVAKAKGCPHLGAGGRVEVLETFEVM